MLRPFTGCGKTLAAATIIKTVYERKAVKYCQSLRSRWLFCYPLAFGSDDPCYEAYWGSIKTNELGICEAQAKLGEAESEFGFGLILFSGTNRHNDRAEGLEWFRKSARHGHQLARLSLANFLSHLEVEKSLRNLPEADAWYRVVGATQAASQLKSRMTEREEVQAEHLVIEYRAKYRETTGVCT